MLLYILHMEKLSTILKDRGLIFQHSGDSLAEIVDGYKRTLYWGVDPTADSMHVGQLQGMLVLRRFLEDGHKLIILVGGGTGMIGDPGGKSEERNLLSDEIVDKNTEALREQFSQLFGGLSFEMVNNADWLRSLNLFEFLRDIGKHFTVNEMVKKDTIRPRLETPDKSISYTEFSYSLLQAYDYLHLHEEFGVDLQVGGSDQWGNILPGVDLIRRKKQEKVHALSWPLLVNKATGKKFGKSEGGTVWLDAVKTSPFQFYQFWLNSEDESVHEYLTKMTMLSLEEVASIMADHEEDPSKRVAQHTLASVVTELVHGEELAKEAQRISGIFFGEGAIDSLSDSEKEALIKGSPSTEVSITNDSSLVDVLVDTGLASSKRDARQLLSGGGVSVNGEKVEDVDASLTKENFQNGLAILRKGKKDMHIIYHT